MCLGPLSLEGDAAREVCPGEVGSARSANEAARVQGCGSLIGHPTAAKTVGVLDETYSTPNEAQILDNNGLIPGILE